MNITKIYCQSPIKRSLKIALVSDLHDRPFHEVVNSLVKNVPDYIAVNGDFLYSCINGRSIYEAVPESGQHLRYSANALDFLKKASCIAPVILSLGNHELYFNEDDRSLLRDIGVELLDDEYKIFGDVVFGGLTSSYHIFAGKGRAFSRKEHCQRWDIMFKSVNISWLDEFENLPGYKILLSHHPEYYDRFLKERVGIHLILSGHAHGGQIRLFGRGFYAYGQGFFPKYTSGLIDGRMIVSRGLANTSKMPRLFNPTELIYIFIN